MKKTKYKPNTSMIIASKRVVQVEEPFNIKVIGSTSYGDEIIGSSGERGIWWFGRGPGSVEVDKAPGNKLGGQILHEAIWKGVKLHRPGVYTFNANSRVIQRRELRIHHPASEGAGISDCIVEVREDISYDGQVDAVKAMYGKTSEWESWMRSDAIRARYENAWERSRSMPTTLRLAFRYGDAPLAYHPPWFGERYHMEALDKMATLAFPGLRFQFLFGADPETTDVLIEVGGLGPTSHACGGNQLYLYYETIFGHEFGHILNIPHHYPGSDISTHIFMPPGEARCWMARNSIQYCSGCRAAMHLDLGAKTSDKLTAIINAILSRYPY